MRITYHGDDEGVRYVALLKADTDNSGTPHQTSVCGRLPATIADRGKKAARAYVTKQVEIELARRRRWWENKQAIIGKEFTQSVGNIKLIGIITAISSRSMKIELIRPKRYAASSELLSEG